MRYSVYEEYKDSGLQWLERVPSAWGIVRLGQVFSERREKVNDKDFEPLSVTMKGIVPRLESAAKSDAGDNRRKVCKGDFVINSRSDRKGSSGLSQLDGSVSLISIVLQPIDIDGSFAHHLLRSYPFQEEFYRFGKGIVADLWSTNYSQMKLINIPLPPKNEQEQIAAFLDRETAVIDTLIAKQEELIGLLQEKRTAVISTAVTKGINPHAPLKDSGIEWLGRIPAHWEVSKIKNICYVNDGNHGEEYPKESDYSNEENGIPFFRAGDFENFRLKKKNLRYISKEKDNSMRKGNLQENDILLVNRGATIGKVALVTKEFNGANLNSQIAYLRVEQKQVHHKYLIYFLSSTYIKNLIISTVHGGALPQYPLKHIWNIDVLLPPLEEQIQIFAYIDLYFTRINLLIEKATGVIELLKERRTALISAAVTGKIDVRQA